MDSRKILMATMSMDIGGAETHIVELSKELKSRGYEIMVASNGGAYVRELEEAGIRHFRTPMHKKTPLSLVKSYLAMRKIIRRERPDVVHAHARISAFVCGLVRRTVKFNFVTTAHWVFRAEGMFGRLSNWGQKTIAVSEDIKDYLIENYKLPEENIFVTINGIDTECFSSKAGREKIREELGLPADARVIVHVSRISRGRAMAASRLIEIAPELFSRAEGLYIVIAGSGDMFDSLSQRVRAVNEAAGRDGVIMLGARTDIADVIAAGDVFVGVSRAALEATSVGLPTIVAGDEGYIGLFHEGVLDVAVATNFCCRGCGETTGEVLMEDLLRCLVMPEAERGALSEYGRGLIVRQYSVERMADLCMPAYEAVLQRNYKILVSGYYGSGNAGDEAILHVLEKSLLDMEYNTEVTVLSNLPERTALQSNMNAVYRFSLFSVLKALKNCDVLISGGGSLLQDKTSTRSLCYYLGIIWLAELFGKRVMVYANGIGPISRPFNQKLAARVLRCADMITLREENSMQALRDLGLRNQEVYVTADPAFYLESCSTERIRAILEQSGITDRRAVMGVSVRDIETNDLFAAKMAELCDYAYEYLEHDILFVIMQNPRDIDFAERIRERMKHPSYAALGEYTPQETIGIVGSTAVMVTMRLHGMIFAAKERVPSVGLVCDPKMEYFAGKLEMPIIGELADFDLEAAKIAVRELLENRSLYQEKLQTHVAHMEEAVQYNTLHLKKVLDLCE